MDTQLESQIQQLLQRGEKLEAIKLMREHTGLGLSEAKKAVEALESKTATQPKDSEIEAKVRELVQQGKALEAIQLVRSAKGSDLKESREYVDFFVLEHQKTLPPQLRKNPYLPQMNLTALGLIAALLVVLIVWLIR